ncbi:thioredoxin family protein, partial [Bacteroidota bacterium]
MRLRKCYLLSEAGMKIKTGLITIIISILFIINFNSCCDCDKKDGSSKIAVVGKMSWTECRQNKDWEDYSAKNYNPDSGQIEDLKKILDSDSSISFIVFSAVWCPDSEDGVPKLFKVLTLAGYDIEKTDIYCVDREKKEPTGTSLEYKLKKVPTLIILKDGRET